MVALGVSDVSAMNTQKVVHIGVPREEDMQKAMDFASDPNNQLWIFSYKDEGEEKIKKGDWEGKKMSWVRWRDNDGLRLFLHDNLGKIAGATFAGPNGDEEARAKSREFADILVEVMKLHNFDNRSAKVLHSDNVPVKNAFLNMPEMLYSMGLLDRQRLMDIVLYPPVSVMDVKGIYKDQPAVVVGAGPSLEDNLIALTELPKYIPIICVARSLKLLQRHWVFPQFIISCEQFHWDSVIFQDTHPVGILCYPAVVAPTAVQAWKGRKMFMVDHNFKEQMGYAGSMDGGNSVAHHAYNLASWLGCDRVYLVGVDLGYPKGGRVTHASGTFHAWPKEVLTQEENPQEELWLEAMDGTRIQSSPAYHDFSTLFSILRAKHKNRLIQTNPKALMIKGAEIGSLSELLRPAPSQARQSQPEAELAIPVPQPS